MSVKETTMSVSADAFPMRDNHNGVLAARREASIASSVGVMNQIYAVRGRNSEIWDVEGRRYIDFAAGIAVANTGHCHPRVVEAVKIQADAFFHTCQHVLPYENYVRLAERLNRLVPGEFSKKTAFFSTGAEAVENAVKIAKASTKRQGVLAFGGGFHGRTHMGMALTGKLVPYKSDFGTMIGHIYHLPFPSVARGVATDDTIESAERLFNETISASQIAAIIIEPVQGEGGFNVATPELIQWLRKLCDLHGIVLIADEVQTGFGRTGNLFAMENFGIAADLTVMAKGIAAGLPLSAVTGRRDLMDAARPGGIGSTYGGNPLAVAAALAVLDVIEDEDLCARAAMLGKELRYCLSEIAKTCASLTEIRGLGSMVAAEFTHRDDGRPNPELVATIRDQARSRGLVLLSAGANNNVIRFLQPLTIPKPVFDEAMAILSASVDAAWNNHAPA